MNKYQEKAMATRMDSCNNLEYMLCGLCSEAGEVAGAYKKHIRGDYDYEKARIAMAKELGDVLWYCAGLADQLGYPLAEIAQMNILKLQSRAERGVLKGNGDER